ncbi:MAG: hypothetical protein ACFE9Z_07310 [Promethearchaeota archaeon]
MSRQYIFTLALYWGATFYTDFQANYFGGMEGYSIFFVLANIPIGIFFLSLLLIQGTTRKRNKELDETIEKLILNYLKSNPGKAYSVSALLKRIRDNIKNKSVKRYLKRNCEDILEKMLSKVEIQTVYKDGFMHYSYSVNS